jgi:hypothetical protein
VSTAASPPTTGHPTPAPPAAPAPIAGESCPLCGAQLQPGQEWCLSCGAAARTRLAAAPNWRGPVAAIALVAALALGGITAALVKLAGETGPGPAPITHTLTTAAPAAVTPPGASAVPTTSVPAPTSTAPAPATTTPTTSSSAPSNGATTTPPTTPTTPTGGTRTKTGSGGVSPTAQKRLEELNLPGRIKAK